jgi:hypothetical protein
MKSGIVALYCALLVLAGPFCETPALASDADASQHDGAIVLILADSLGLCGFGKRLDEHFRRLPGVKAVYTFMACGTQPLSWLKERPYANVKTRCGFWSIESGPYSPQFRELKDVYGMRRGWVPAAHPVPKLEELVANIRPDVLVMQTGGNLFDLFPDHKTVRPDRDAAALRDYVFPFVVKAISPPSPLKKIYWIASPTSGRVSKAVQDFVVDQVRAQFGAAAMIIDSRALISYPYRHMEPDHEHFVGEDMDRWADKVFGILSGDLAAKPLASLKPLSEAFPQIASTNPPSPVTSADASDESVVNLSARLVFKSKPMSVEEFLPYQESLVGYVYDVRRVLSGRYNESQVLVMHPAYIGLRKQSLRKYKIGKAYRLKLHQLEGTPWNTVKRKDDSGLINLEPYIQVEDENKYPGTSRSN